MWYLIAGLVITLYAIINLAITPTVSGAANVIAQSLCWIFLAITTLKISRSKHVQILRSNKFITITAATIAIFQIVTLIFTGIFSSFGKSPYQFAPLAVLINITFFMSTLVGFELSRAYIVKTCSRRYATLTLGLTALLYAVVILPLSRYTSLNLTSPLDVADFSASIFLPLLAESLLASYIVLIAGAIPAITYRGILQGFEWLSPILPNPSWSVKALIGVMVPTVGYLIMHQSTIPQTIRRHGRMIRIKKPKLLGWIIVATLCVVAVWAPTGLLGFRPSIISSGSMRPTIDVGDIAITIQTQPQTIKIGDIIEYWEEGKPIVHRVVNINMEGTTRYFITKGDDNNAPDPNPVHPNQILGKLVLTIPKLGWASIYLKEFAANTYTFLTTTLPQTLTDTGSFILTNGVYITSALAFTAYSYLLLTYKTIKKKEEKHEN